MPTTINIGTEKKDVDLLDLFRPIDGEITQRYGRIGQGKTYGATCDVIEELKKGHIVYTNWHIDWLGYDQRDSWLYIIGSLIFPFKRELSFFPPSNLRYINIDENFIDTFSTLTNCSVYLDEGHVVFDSYEMAKMSMAKRVAVLHTRHFDRSIHIISQRPTAIHRVLRGNVNRFYKYEKFGRRSPFILFRRTEYQDMKDEMVDEEQPLSVKLYLFNKKLSKAYNSKYLNELTTQIPAATVYKLNYFQKIALFLRKIWRTAVPLGRR